MADKKYKIEISENQMKAYMDEMQQKTITILSGMEFDTQGELKAYIDGLKMAQGNMNSFMDFVITRASYNYDSEVSGNE